MINSKLVMEALEKNQLDLQIMLQQTKELRDHVVCYGISHLNQEDKDVEFDQLAKSAEQLAALSKKINIRSSSVKNIFIEKKESIM